MESPPTISLTATSSNSSQVPNVQLDDHENAALLRQSSPTVAAGVANADVFRLSATDLNGKDPALFLNLL